ncbi:MAG TPA: ABC transporter permease subunit [Gemmataceae bacterium]|nr:ABC transporter permease subunit [Gemmataceae bacterium]
MSLILVRKLLRDLRWGLLIMGVLLFAFNLMWCKSTQQGLELFKTLSERGINVRFLAEIFFNSEGGKVVAKMVGGERITIGQGIDSLSVGYVHPLLITMLSVWAVGRAAGTIAGELDKGTMELLLAQPLARWRVIGSHFVIDCVTIPILCACLWAGTALGCLVFGLYELTIRDMKQIDMGLFVPALVNIAAFLFAISGYTMTLSAAGRFRPRVLGIAVVLTLVQFFVNLLGQTWSAIESLRPWTVFYYYQPQGLILEIAGASDENWTNVLTLLAVGTIGYVAALVIFIRRDLPAPL